MKITRSVYNKIIHNHFISSSYTTGGVCTKNQLGSITAITDNSGKVVEEYKYDVFGKTYMRAGKSNNWIEFKGYGGTD